MALTDKLTAIADAIRGKTGKTDTLTLDGMVTEIEELSTEEVIAHAEIPDYVKTAVVNVVNKVKSVATDESIIFPAIADPHHCASQQISGWTNNINTGNLHAGMALKTLSYALKFDFACVLGDVTVGSADTTVALLEEQLAEINTWTGEAFKGIPRFYTPGNHDTGWYRYASTNSTSDLAGADLLYKYFGSLCEGAVYGSEEFGYCYRDFEDKKLRVICLNCVEGETQGTQAYCCSAAQLLWFAQTLYAVGSKSDAASWSVLVMCHYPLDYGGMMTTASKVLYAYVSGGSTTQNGTTVNFSGHNAAKAIGQIHGHTHCFRWDNLYWADQLHTTAGVYEAYPYEAFKIGVPNACFERNNTSASATWNGVTWGEDSSRVNDCTKKAGTYKDTAFVVNVINPSEQKLYSFCYGAGYDREISYRSIIYYSIATNLTNFTINNTSTSVEENTAYSATLTITSGCNLDYIKVTMGGTDVTSSVLSGTTINITKVTGNVVITAVAIAPPKNQLPLAINTDGTIFNGTGYKSGVRLSTSDGGERTLSGSYISGFIPITAGQTITLKNVGTGSVSGTASYLIWFKSLGTNQLNRQLSLSTISTNSDGSLTITLDKATHGGDHTAVQYFRLSCSYLGTDSEIYVK